MAIGLKYRKSCVNCLGVNTDERNEKGLPCEICLPHEVEDLRTFLERNGNLKGLKYIWDLEENFRDISSFFEEKIGSKPNGFQRMWMKRVLLGKSFTAIAPTGMGKTTFGILVSAWFSKKGKRSILVLPTLLLVDQVFNRLKDLGEVKIVRYHSKMPKRDREDSLESIEKGDFDVLVVSTQFLSRRFEVLKGKKFDFVFVDDVDAILKASKNIERILMILGVDEETINKAYEKIKGKDVEIPKVDHGVLVVSSATAKPRGIRHLLFREILGFDVGRLVVSSRNITNVRVREKSFEKLLEVLKILRSGILVFAKNSEESEKIREYLENGDFKVGGDDEKSFEMFKKGELDILVGVSSYYGKLVRGLDLPKLIKFTVFYGAPTFEYPISLDKAPRFVLKRVLRELSKRDSRYERLFKMIDRTKDLDTIRKEVDLPENVWMEKVKEVFSRFRIEDGVLKIPDVLTYIQASGRASRLTKWGLTKGVSVLLEDDDVIFENLKERLEWLVEEEWVDFDEVEWESLLKEVEESREFKEEKALDFESVLVVVESPTKAGTLSNFFGRSSTRYYKGLSVHETIFENRLILFTASRGHVYDLVTDEGIHGIERTERGFVPVYGPIKRCRDCGYQFTDDHGSCPRCGSRNLDDKFDVLESLRELSLEVDRVIVTTDPDTEGEKISHDVFQHVKPVNGSVERMELHEITRSEFKKGVENLRGIDQNLVRAQVVRRVQDRWVGFELSGKVQERFKRSNLSAGRVQSTVLGWIVEREEEYSKSEKTFTRIEFAGRSLEIEGELKAKRLEVLNVEESIEEISPPPPFTTDTVLSEVSRRLKISPNEIMSILQDLFERGFITYHRTDSTRISPTGQGVAKKLLERMNLDIFQGRSWGEGGAHEAIRPAKPLTTDELQELVDEGILKNLSRYYIIVYDMILRRFLRSQSKNVKVVKQRVSLRIGDRTIEDETIAEILENGWNLIEPLKTFRYEKKEYEIDDLKIYKKHTVPLFTQATIIEEMKKRGIGRPSTYAKIVETLFQRKYVVEDRYGRVRPTKLGKMVYEFLKENFPEYVTDETTRKLEEMMDEVENGERDYQETLKVLYLDLERIRKR